MGLELVLLLVNRPALQTLVDLSWQALYSGMEKGEFRHIRPPADSRLKRSFAGRSASKRIAFLTLTWTTRHPGRE